MKKNQMVSIIVPIYNTEKYIERCIKSIIEQTYKNIEIILINDGSNDGSLTICNKYSEIDSRIKVIDQENGGVVKARRCGLMQASGEFVLFVDSDDWIEPHMAEKLINGIGDADVISSEVYRELYPGKVQICGDNFEKSEYLLNENGKDFFSRMVFDMKKHQLQPLTPWLWNKLFRRDRLAYIFKDVDESISFAEDALILYKYVLSSKKIRFLHEPFYHYCYYENSLAHNVGYNRLENVGKIYKESARIFSEMDISFGLMEQVNRWIAIMTKIALGQSADINQARFLEFLFDTRLLNADVKRIAIYGAGGMGQDYIYQLCKLGYKISAVVDSNWEYWRDRGFDVSSPVELSNLSFDAVIIAVVSPSAVKEIKNTLKDLSISDDKIICNDPIVL